jgi:hypothetical protein
MYRKEPTVTDHDLLILIAVLVALILAFIALHHR